MNRAVIQLDLTALTEALMLKDGLRVVDIWHDSPERRTGMVGIVIEGDNLPSWHEGQFPMAILLEDVQFAVVKRPRMTGG